MSIKFALVFLVLVFATPRFAVANICNFCDRRCGWHQVACKTKKAICKASVGPFLGYVKTANTICKFDKNKFASRKLIRDTKNLLVRRGYFTKPFVDSVSYRFCRVISIGAAGMAPASNVVLFADKYRFRKPCNFAWLMAHELKHIEQYRRWGTGGFACRYSGQLVRGRGFKWRNYVEREAYEFDGIVRRDIRC